jgi:hypothetical protein
MGTIIAADRQDAGNLRRFFPEARVVRLDRPRYVPPARPDLPSKVAVVWREGEGKRGSKEVEKELGEIARGLGSSPERVRIR